MLDIFRGSLRVLFRRKTRTVLTIIGIAVGVASVILINNIGQCGRNALTSEIDGLGMGGLSVMLKNQSAPLADEELNTINSLSYVEYAMPLMFEATDAYIKGEKNQVYLWGINNDADDMIDLHLIHGRFINTGDVSSCARSCIIDEKLARDSYGTDNVVGKKMLINSGGKGAEYRIIGVVRTGSGILENMMGSFVPAFLYIPYTTLQADMNTDNYSQIAVKLDPDRDSEEASEQIIKAMERGSDIKGAYLVTDLSKQKENIGNMISIFTAVLSCVGVVSLFVAGLSIMNVMLVSVSERKREIGIKKALGATSGMIVWEFLFEAVILTLSGAAAGIIFGTLVSVIGAGILGLTLMPRLDIIITAALFSLITGMIFGSYPAFKAARLRPVEALRTL